MNKTVLKIRFDGSFKNAVVMQILEQDKEFFASLKGNGFKSSNNIDIYFQCRPQLSESCIFLQGKHQENDFDICTFKSNNPTEYITKAVEALTEAVQSLLPSREPQKGEAVFVRNNDAANWKLRIFIKHAHAEDLFTAVNEPDMNNYINGKSYTTYDWCQMKHRNQSSVDVTRYGDVWTWTIKEG